MRLSFDVVAIDSVRRKLAIYPLIRLLRSANERTANVLAVYENSRSAQNAKFQYYFSRGQLLTIKSADERFKYDVATAASLILQCDHCKQLETNLLRIAFSKYPSLKKSLALEV